DCAQRQSAYWTVRPKCSQAKEVDEAENNPREQESDHAAFDQHFQMVVVKVIDGEVGHFGRSAVGWIDELIGAKACSPDRKVPYDIRCGPPQRQSTFLQSVAA